MPEAPDTEEQARSTQPRRRQARGERRIAQLLEAAAGVFCRNGYTAASTNAIAREAGVSPGTLYQFFPNKEAIAVELGGRLMQRWRETHGAALDALDPSLPLDQLLDSVLDPLIEFNCENPAFAVLMHGSEIPGRITEEHDAVHSALLERVEEILGDFLPSAGPAQLSRVANMTFCVVKAGLELILAHEGAEQDAYKAELKAMVHRYLRPLVDTAALPEDTRTNTP
ncbi:TetR/AcrR family transcriptional regulator [Streptomyces wuyuanensis]|uniref:TetR/AcrR family transcriptional regulator n=1 Tax=Streptomyces wuyuanensis TaxID=1196353 RepID=UPI003D718F40